MRRRHILSLALLVAAGYGQQPTFKANARLVVLNVFAKDKSGKDLLTLKKEDFTVLEDGKPQNIAIFELQKLDSEPSPASTTSTSAAPPAIAKAQQITTRAPGEIQYRDRRLMVFFFDLSSMPPTDQIRAGKAALKFIDQQMKPSDLVALMTFSTKLEVKQDFTDNRDQLREAIKELRIGEGSDLAGEASTGSEDEADTGAAFQADESEFNIFNTDRKLGALESAAKMLANLPEKKALIYFSSGVGKTGMENQSQLQSTMNAAIRANVSFYPVDSQGLQAAVPGGDASQAASRGSGIFSGSTQRGQMSRRQDQQETLVSLASGTGGKAFLDDNDLSLGIVQAQEDIRSYYIVGYYSGNDASDGKFRRIQVRLQAPNNTAKLDYRNGYYASKEFAKFTESDKEQQLEEALAQGDPVTDLPIAMEINHFRLSKDRFFVPVAVKIPGSEVTLAKKGDTELDFIGQIRDGKGRLAGTVRDGIRLKLTEADRALLEKRNLQYDTGFTLAPGQYKLKFLARENQNGRIGTFETGFTVPDLQAPSQTLRVSSVVLSNQRESMKAAIGSASNDKKLLAQNPLVDNGQKLIPNITRVFRKGQSLYVYAEVYDASVDPADQRASVLASVAFYRGRTKAFEASAVRIQQAAAKRPGVYPVQFEVPLEKLHSGQYTCQLTLVDEVGKKFAFPRSSMVLIDAAPAVPKT
jgi:VWFA-related protein